VGTLASLELGRFCRPESEFGRFLESVIYVLQATQSVSCASPRGGKTRADFHPLPNLISPCGPACRPRSRFWPTDRVPVPGQRRGSPRPSSRPRSAGGLGGVAGLVREVSYAFSSALQKDSNFFQASINALRRYSSRSVQLRTPGQNNIMPNQGVDHCAQAQNFPSRSHDLTIHAAM